jgi:hypothetical protein
MYQKNYSHASLMEMFEKQQHKKHQIHSNNSFSRRFNVIFHYLSNPSISKEQGNASNMQ